MSNSLDPNPGIPSVSNSLDPNQDEIVRPDLDPYCLQNSSADFTNRQSDKTIDGCNMGFGSCT